MSKYFRPWNIDQTLLLPPNVQDFVPKGHVSRFIVALVRESLDLGEITGSYVSGLGQPPFDPRMMEALLHGYASGLYSSRRIAKACRERNDFVMIVALDPPDFRTIRDFRKRHLKALGALFLQVLKLCETAGLVKLGHVALDGTKIKANASKHKAMSYERMKKREAELKAEVARILACDGPGLVRRTRYLGARLCRHDSQIPGLGIPSRSYPGHDAALHHAAAEPSLHRRHTWEAAGCTGRPEKGHRDRGAQHLGPASVVETGRVAASGQPVARQIGMTG
jgi:transposase